MEFIETVICALDERAKIGDVRVNMRQQRMCFAFADDDGLMEKTALGQRKVRGVAVAADDASRFNGVLCKSRDRRFVHMLHRP